MYYELYVDVLFLVNFMMDYLLLLLVKKMLLCSATHGKICMGAALGAALTCVTVLLPVPHPLIKLVILHLLVSTCMIRIGLGIKTMRTIVKGVVMLYIGGFLLGGILEFFHQYVKWGSLLFALAIAGYYLTLGIWKFINYLQRWNQSHCTVVLYVGGNAYEFHALIDTGNSLRDPVSLCPVSILERKSAMQCIGGEGIETLRYIPYHTIGNANGVMPVFYAEKMCVCRDTLCWIDRPLIGISEETVSTIGEYDMILSPNLF